VEDDSGGVDYATIVRVHDGGGTLLDVGDDLLLHCFGVEIFGLAGGDTLADLFYRVADCLDDDFLGKSPAGSGGLESF
jgi:hypothetical protein